MMRFYHKNECSQLSLLAWPLAVRHAFTPRMYQIGVADRVSAKAAIHS
jgi:hypothetical protein